MRRRHLILRSLVAGTLVWIGTLAMLNSNQALAEVQKETFTYKSVGDLKIQADVFHHDDDRLRPVMVWLHGGALINGHREAIDNRLKTAMLEAGYIVVSLDYRLPTLMIHGEVDTDVPYEQSVLMAAEFKRHGVEHRLISLPGGEHGLAGADRELIDQAHQAGHAFIRQHLGKP